MAGNAPLVGERALKAQRLLRSVTDILDAAGVRYWLDHGTLLGIVREQRLLPWDTDMDISLCAEDMLLFKQCIPALRSAGLRVRIKHCTSNAEPFGVGRPRLIKIRDRKWFFFRGELLLDVFVTYRHGGNFYWAVNRRADKQQIVLTAPARFFETLDSIEFDGKSYPTPSDREAYLAYRYGDWRTPVKRWNCLVDDRALVT